MDERRYEEEEDENEDGLLGLLTQSRANGLEIEAERREGNVTHIVAATLVVFFIVTSAISPKEPEPNGTAAHHRRRRRLGPVC